MLCSDAMAAQSQEEAHRARRRERLVQGLLLGAAAVGVPALANLFVSRRARRLTPISWGSGDRYAWKHGEIVYQRLGDGEPIVLLHSFGPGHSSTEWRRSAVTLAESHRVYAPDFLGWGRSEKPIRRYRAQLYVEQVVDFLEEVVAGEGAHVVAAGMSAAYATRVAAERPELVRSLALVVPFGVGVHGAGPDFKDALVYRLLRLPIIGTAALNLFTSHSAIAAYLRREVYGSPHAVDDALVERHYRDSHQLRAHVALAAYLSDQLDHDVRDALARVEVPVWLAWGRQALSPPVESADLWLDGLADGMTDAELEVFEQCGILPHAESPTEFAEKLEQFVGERA